MNTAELHKILACSCVTPLPPEQHAPIFDDRPEGVLAIWANRNKFWTNSALKLRFINGDTKQRAMAMAQIEEVDSLCGISFKVVNAGPSDIRIGFNRGSGHWSYVGIDCRSIPQNQQTMNVDLTARDTSTEFRRVVQHEALHALGFNHEHQHPRNKIPWNREAVFQFYGQTQGWSRAEIEAQVLRRGSALNFFGTEPDLTSIMQYPIARQLVTDARFAVGWNSKMSALDIQTLQSVYR